MNNIFYKACEIKYIIVLLPIRIKRFFLHFSFFIPWSDYSLPAKPASLKIWVLDLFFYMIDLIGISDLLHCSHILSKRSFKKLSEAEIDNLFEIFQGSIDYNCIWIDDNSRIGLRKLANAYVLFNSINYNGVICFPTLVHEILHVWQYQNLGSMYLGRALWAQTQKDPYFFGGPQQLYNDMINGKKLLTYNFEQQGAIFEYLIGLKKNNNSHPLLNPIMMFYQKELWEFEKM